MFSLFEAEHDLAPMMRPYPVPRTKSCTKSPGFSVTRDHLRYAMEVHRQALGLFDVEDRIVLQKRKLLFGRIAAVRIGQRRVSAAANTFVPHSSAFPDPSIRRRLRVWLREVPE